MLLDCFESVEWALDSLVVGFTCASASVDATGVCSSGCVSTVLASQYHVVATSFSAVKTPFQMISKDLPITFIPPYTQALPIENSLRVC